jgi:hypothetical protein
LVGREWREIGSGIGELLVFRPESVDRQHDAIAIPGKCPLIDTVACLGIGVKAFRDETVHEPCGLAYAGQDTMAEDRQGGGLTSERAAKPAAEISDDNFSDPLRALGHAGGEPRLPLDRGYGNPVPQEEAVAHGARGRIGARARHRSGNADCPRKDGPPTIWRLNDDGVRVRCGFWRNDVEADLIGNGRPSACKPSQPSNRLCGRDFAVYGALDIAKAQAGVASDRLDVSNVDAGDGRRIRLSHAYRSCHRRCRQ